MGGWVPVGLTKDIIADITGQVDFPRGPRKDISSDKSSPEHMQVLALGDCAIGGRRRMMPELLNDGIECFPVSLGLEGEL